MRAPMMKNGRTHTAGECSCCNVKRERRKSKHTARQSERRAWKKEQWS